MHTDRPVTRIADRCGPGKRPGLRVFLMVLLGAGCSAPTALAAPPPAAKAADAPANGGRARRVRGRRHLRHLSRGGGEGIRHQSSHQDGPDARERQWRDLRELSRGGQRARSRRRRRDQDLQSRQGLGQRSGREVPELPRRRASQLRALAARQGRRRLHQLPQHSRQQGRDAAQGLRSPRSASSATPTRRRSSTCPSTTR